MGEFQTVVVVKSMRGARDSIEGETGAPMRSVTMVRSSNPASHHLIRCTGP